MISKQERMAIDAMDAHRVKHAGHDAKNEGWAEADEPNEAETPPLAALLDL